MVGREALEATRGTRSEDHRRFGRLRRRCELGVVMGRVAPDECREALEHDRRQGVVGRTSEEGWSYMDNQ